MITFKLNSVAAFLFQLKRIQVVAIQVSSSAMMDVDSTPLTDDSVASPSLKSEESKSPGTRSPGSDPLALGAVETISLEQGIFLLICGKILH